MISLITDRDKLIILHLEKYKYATIEQLEKIFFRHQKNSYNIARRRMAEIKKAGYAKAVRDIETNKVVYIYNDEKCKTPDRHRIVILDVLADLHYHGFNVQLFEIEKFWQNGKIRSDAFTVFTLENDNAKNRYHYFIEVHFTNHKCNLEKYDELFDTGEVQQYLGRNVYPRIMLVTDRKIDYDLKHSSVIKLNSKLDDFSSIILPDKSLR